MRGFNDDIPITPMKLQKLMYFTCRDYLKKTGRQLISEPFEVWKYGPVLSSVYGEFSSFGSNPIDAYAKDAKGNSVAVSEKDNPTLKEVADLVWKRFKHYDGVALSKMTHRDGSGWHRAYNAGSPHIAKEDMLNDSI